MKQFFWLILLAAIAALAGDLSGSVVPDRKSAGENAPPKNFTNNVGMKFVWIPAGSFMMGSPKEELERHDDETQHRVTLTKAFYLGIHLVSQDEWQAVMGYNRSYFKGEKNLPVERV